MTISVAELAYLPTAPTVSKALKDAALRAADGPIDALTGSVYGSTNPADYAGIVTPEHTLAWAVALIATARVLYQLAGHGTVSPETVQGWPDNFGDAGRFSNAVGDAHRSLTSWAMSHSVQEVAGLFLAAAEEAEGAER